MLDNPVNNVSGFTGSDSKQKVIPLKVNNADWRKERKFLKDRNQLETVLGPSRISWFDELTERALLSKKEVKKENKTVFDSPGCSPSVSQLIKNQLKVGNSPPEFYHSSPALDNKILFDDNPFSTPDNHGHWCRPTLGISPSPVPKDGSFLRRSSSIMGSLGLSNEDSVLSWSNSLATPPRDDSTIVSTVSTPTHHKDPVRALFSPHQNTSESLEPLESTNEEEILQDVYSEETKQANFDELTNISDDTKFSSNNLKQDLLQDVSVPNEKSMDAWRDKFRRKLILKSDSFGKQISSSNKSHHFKSAEKKRQGSSSTIIQVTNEEFKDNDTEKNDTRQTVHGIDNKKLNIETENNSIESENEGTCLSPVFPKQSISNGESSAKSKRVKSRTEVVGDALSDFFDSPAGAVGKRNSLNRKRKSSEMEVTEFDNSLNEIESVLSTPKTVVLQSILSKDKHLKSSSGKKVRFSECVVKYSEEKAKNGSFSKRRRKHLHAKREAVLNELKQISIEKKESDTKISLEISDDKSNDVSKTPSVEGEDVFSQVSPTALEAMCSAAMIKCDNVNSEVTCAGDNSVRRIHDQKIFDPGKMVIEAIPGKQNVPCKKFLYPTKRNLVNTNQSTIFIYKEDGKGDHKGKGIVSAIDGTKIVCKTENNVQKHEQGKPDSGENVNKSTSESNNTERLIKDKFTCSVEINSNIGENQSVGFQSASGKDIILADDAVNKAKKLFDEEHSSLTQLENKEVVMKSNNQTSDYAIIGKSNETDKKEIYFEDFDEEDFESKLWCEDFVINQDNVNQIEEDKLEIEFEEQYRDMNERKKSELNKALCNENDWNKTSVEVLNSENQSFVDYKTHQNSKKKELKTEILKSNIHVDNNESRNLDFSENDDCALISLCNKDSLSTDLTYNSHIGFSTAGGRVLQFDAVKLQKAEQMFSSTDVFNHEHSVTDSKGVKAFKDVSKGNIDDMNNMSEVPCSSKQPSVTNIKMGFSSTSENSNAFPNNAGEKAITFYAGDIQLGPDCIDVITNSSTNLCSASDKTFDVSSMTGFTTASGKTFRLSNSSIEKAQNILTEDTSGSKDIELLSDNEHYPFVSTKTMFTSASGKPFNLSKASIEKAQNMLKEETQSESDLKRKNDSTKLSPEQPVSISNISGFTSASGKAFSLSKSAIEKAQHVLEEDTQTASLSMNILKPKGEGRSKTIPLHELFKQELENSNKVMDIDLMNQEIVGLKSTLIKSDATTTISKTASPSNLVKPSRSDHISRNKPKGFRPFKAPKRVTVQSHDSKSSSVSCMEISPIESKANLSNVLTSETETSLHAYQTDKKPAHDQNGHVKTGNTENKLPSTIQERVLNVAARQDIYEGIFSQMFADDMELEEPSAAENILVKDEKVASMNNVSEKVEDVSNKTCDSLVNIDETILTATSISRKNFYFQEGFQKASGNEIKISSNAPQKAINLADSVCQEIYLKDRSKDKVAASKQTLNIKTSDKLGSRVLSNFCETQISREGDGTAGDVESVSQHFTECNNESLIEISNEQFNEDEKSNFPCYQTMNMYDCKDVKEDSEKKCQNVKSRMVNNISEESPFIGFQTAGGKNILISENAIETARNNFYKEEAEEKVDTLLQIDTRIHSEELTYNKMVCTGFQTAGGKEVKTSEKALQKAKITSHDPQEITDEQNVPLIKRDQVEKILTENMKEGSTDKLNIENKTSISNAIGSKTNTEVCIEGISKDKHDSLKAAASRFQTAQSKDIQISESFLEGTQLNFDQERRICQIANPSLKTFETTGEMGMEIFDKSVKGTRMSLDMEKGKLHRPPILGFQTAGGRNIEISAKSLEEARKSLNRNDLEDKQSNTTFQTAGSEGSHIKDESQRESRISLNLKNNLPDKPSYMGFHTAGGKIVEVSEKALEEAKKNLSREDNLSKSIYHTDEKNASEILARSPEEAKNTMNDDEKVSDYLPAKGFKTASGKEVVISNSSIIEARKTLIHEEEIEQHHIKEERKINVPIKIRERSKCPADNRNNEVSKSNRCQIDVSKNVSVSDSALNDGSTTQNNEQKLMDNQPNMRFITAGGKDTTIPERSNEDKTLNNNKDFLGRQKFVGFQTARGKEITISKKALEITQEMFNSEDHSYEESDFKPLSHSAKSINSKRKIANTDFECLNTAKSISNVSEFEPAFKMNMSDEGQNYTKQTLEDTYNCSDQSALQGFKPDLDKDTGISEHFSNESGSSSKSVRCKESMPSFSGFQTARGNNIKVSEKALQAAKSTLNSEEETFKGFQSAAGNIIPVSEEAIRAVRHCLKGSGENSNSTKKSDNQKCETLLVDGEENDTWRTFGGFHTAGGSRISCSDEALQAARKHLNSDKEFLEQSIMTGFQTAKGHKVKLSADSLNKVRETLSKAENDRNASNITLLDESMKLDRKGLISDERLNEERIMTGFQTARGHKVKLSADSLNKARETLSSEGSGMHDLNMALCGDVLKEHGNLNQDKELNKQPIMTGFQTASGNKVKLSADSLTIARDMLTNADTDSQRLTAVNHGNSISRKSSIDNIQEKGSNDIATKVSSCFPGFQTASGTNVKVSDKALEYARGQHLQFFYETEKSRLTLSDTMPKTCSTAICSKTGDYLQGFQTACGKAVHVSDKALEHAKGELIQSVDVNGGPASMNSSDEEKKLFCMLDSALSIKRQKLGSQQEKHILHKSGNADNNMKRKPLRSAPEGVTTDRRHPGFRPFKPVICRQIDKQQTQSKEVITSKPASNTEVKPSFQTPYKKSSSTTQTHAHDKIDSQTTGSISTKTPVFNSKLKHSFNNSGELHTSKVDIRTSANQITLEIHSETVENVGRLSENKSEGTVEGILPSLSGTDCKKVDISNKRIQNKDGFSLESENVEKVSVSHDLVMETSDMSSFSQDEDDLYYFNLVEARTRQDEMIETRKKNKVEPVTGRLYEMKQIGDRIKMADILTSNESKIKKKILVTSTMAEEYKFDIKHHYGNQSAHVLLGDGAFLVPNDDGKAGKEQFFRAFLTMDGVDSKLISDVWLYNHYRWIVWKLAAYEMTSCFNGRSLTPENVMLQLKYRYDREIDRAERSCLKKIYEKDDTSCKRLVLCVSNLVFNRDKVTNVANPDLQKVLVEMTDGWYKVPVQFDGPLIELCCQGRITIGQKLCITGAELVGSQDACTPLEAPADLHLKININSTRQAKGDSRLGYQTDPRPLCVPLVSLYEEGGNIGYMEKLCGGGCIFRSQRDEDRVQQQCQTRKQVEMEKLYNTIQKEMELEQKQDSIIKKGKMKYSITEIEQFSTGEEIHDAMENSVQPDRVQNYLSDRQQGLLYEYQRCLQDERRHKLNMRVQATWQDREDETPTERNVTPVLKFRVAGCANTDLDSQKSTILTVWRPASEISDLKEGKRYKVYSLNASSSRSKYTGSSVQLTATKQTKFMQLQIDENLLDRIYEPREVLYVNDIKRRQPPFGELDFVGLVVRVVLATNNESIRSPDMMYIADCQCNILGVKFWNGIKSFGEDVCTEGTYVCVSNLMDKAVYRNKYLPSVEATPEFTNITHKPQNTGQRLALDKLQSVLKNKPSFKDDVVTALDSLLANKIQTKSPIEKNATSGYKRDSLCKHITTTSDSGMREMSNTTTTTLDKDNENMVENKELYLESKDEFSFDVEMNVEETFSVIGLEGSSDKISDKINVLKETVDDGKESPTKEDTVVSKTASNPSVTDSGNVSGKCATPVRNTGNENCVIQGSQHETPASQPRQSQVQSRLARLSMYGTPDSLSPLPVSVPRSVSKGFKPPSLRKKLN